MHVKIAPKFCILELKYVARVFKAKVTTLTYEQVATISVCVKVGCPACCLKTKCGPADFGVWAT